MAPRYPPTLIDDSIKNNAYAANRADSKENNALTFALHSQQK